MEFLLSEFQAYRRLVQNEVLTICRNAGAIVYGSFANGTFHLNSEDWDTYSDLDLISTDIRPDVLSARITEQIYKRIGLTIRTKVRENTNHIDNLPESLSQQLSFIDTAIALLRGVESRGFCDYLLIKFILRAVYLDRYLSFNVNFVCSKQQSKAENEDIFFSLMRYKLKGKSLSKQEFEQIISGLKSVDANQLGNLLTLCSLNNIFDLMPYWRSFSSEAHRLSLHGLLEDIARKLEFAKRVEHRVCRTDALRQACPRRYEAFLQKVHCPAAGYPPGYPGNVDIL